jgi:hypothetical protein
VVEGLLEPKGMAQAVPRIELFADVTGDAMKERISVFDKYFTVCGPGYRGGKQFFYRELSYDLSRVEARDVTGKGKEALLVRKRIVHQGTAHEAFEVWTFAKDEPETAFSHVVAVTAGAKKVTNALRVSPGEIEVTVEPAVGWDATSYREPGLAETEALLMPWGAVKSVTYKFDGSRFAKSGEVAQAGQKPEGPASKPVAELPRDVPTPEVGKGGDLSARVYDQYLADQKVAAGTKPKVDLKVQVNGDARPERVVVIGKDLVVLGPGYKGGSQYAFARLADFATPDDITEVTARDITGDGLAEIVVRGKVKLSPTVDSEVMLVYGAAGDRVVRLLAIETAREVAGGRIQGLVQFVPSKGCPCSSRGARRRRCAWCGTAPPSRSRSRGAPPGDARTEPPPRPREETVGARGQLRFGVAAHAPPGPSSSHCSGTERASRRRRLRQLSVSPVMGPARPSPASAPCSTYLRLVHADTHDGTVSQAVRVHTPSAIAQKASHRSPHTPPPNGPATAQ